MEAQQLVQGLEHLGVVLPVALPGLGRPQHPGSIHPAVVVLVVREVVQGEVVHDPPTGWGPGPCKKGGVTDGYAGVVEDDIEEVQL